MGDYCVFVVASMFFVSKSARNYGELLDIKASLRMEARRIRFGLGRCCVARFVTEQSECDNQSVTPSGQAWSCSMCLVGVGTVLERQADVCDRGFERSE